MSSAPPDNRRITEDDPAVARLHARTVRLLAASLRLLVSDLKAGRMTINAAQEAFITRHMGILRDAYLAGHAEGQRDYYDAVSATPGQFAGGHYPQDITTHRVLAFYAPSVVKMAHEAALAYAATPAPAQALIDDERGAMLFNPNHGKDGRFAPGAGGGRISEHDVTGGGSHGARQHEGIGHVGSHLAAAHSGGHGGAGGGSGSTGRTTETTATKAAKPRANTRQHRPAEKPAEEKTATAKSVKSARVAKGGKAASVADESARVQQIASKDIHVGLNPREHFDKASIDELAASIKENGLLQPISVRAHGDGYQIIAGERRFRAMQQLGYEHVPAIVHNVTDEQAHRLALIENINRVDMRPSETAKAYKALMDRGMSADEVAKAVGKSQAHVNEHLALLQMAPHLQKAVDEGHIPASIVGAMAKLSPKGQEDVAERVMGEGLGVRSARALIRAKAAQEAQTSMFPEVKAPTHSQTDARVKYEETVARVTQALHGLDDETMAVIAQVVRQPFDESTRLDLMAKQLRRMQNILQQAGHARNLAKDQGAAASIRELSMALHEALMATIQLGKE